MKVKQVLSRAVKLLLFFLIAALLFCLISVVLTPKWSGLWKSSDTVTGFYSLEEDSIDTLVLGSSQVISGISAVQLYQEEGIRAYSLGTEQQPLIGSYYLLKDALRTQPRITTVVLEVTELFVQSKEANYRKVFDYMPLTSVKWEGMQAHVQWAEKLDAAKGTDTAPSLASYVLPILSFHDRWYELSRDDFTYFLQDRTDPFRGFSIQSKQGAKAEEGKEYEPLDIERTTACALPKEEGLCYFQAICDLCAQQNISLVLVKTPRADWTEKRYNTITALSKEYDVPYLDFNTPALSSAINYHFATDALVSSPTHLNLSGAGKLTAYLGDYLTKHCPALDVRTNPSYDSMAQEVTTYRQAVNDANLILVDDFKSYLSHLSRNRYSLLFAVNASEEEPYPDDIQLALTQLGLDPRMSSGGCYVAALEHGTVLADQWSGGTASQSVALADDAYATLTSDGGKNSVACSITIDGTEYALNEPGLNIVVYNHETGQVADSVAFDFSEPESTAER